MAKHWETANERFAFFERVLTMVEGPPERTQTDVARELGLSRGRVHQIINQAKLIRSATEGTDNADQ